MKRTLAVLRGIAGLVFVVFVLGIAAVGGFVAVTLAHYERDLPDYQQLANYIPAMGSKVYAGDGSFMGEFATEHRIPVSIGKIPKPVIQAFLAAEDRDFYTHIGVNPVAIFRAGLADILRIQRGQRPIGASTITQQVVRHFLLTNEVSVSRKIKEAILAYRIEKTLSKDRILEIYLNEIYFGAGAYGVAAAADTYFQKPLDQLTLAETAFLAALPKAPSNYNPMRHAAAARARRDYVLSGMAELGWVTQAQAKAAMAEPLGVHLRSTPGDPMAGQNGYFLEEVRRELIGRFGEKTVYEGGLTVRTSYAPVYQTMAETAFRQGLVAYDRRHGWRGPLAHLPTGAAAENALATKANPPGPIGWRLAAVTAIDGGGATIAVKNGGSGRIPLEELRWARHTTEDQRLGTAVRQVQDVVTPGDLVLVEATAAAGDRGSKGRRSASAGAIPTYGLRQIPDVSGGTVVMDPKTGRVFALVGGWSFQQSQFDRATQAKRQPGSSFKPFVYMTALQNGFTPQSVVDDAPIEIPQGPGLPPWKPVNYEGTYAGPSTLEDALIHSRNLVTARLATMIGLPAIAKTVQDFDVMDKMPLYYSMSLGAGETTLLRLTNAYAMIDNGGHWLLPSVIDLVQDRDGHILYQKGVGGCAGCFAAAGAHNGSDASTLFRPTGPADGSSIYLPNATYAASATVYKPTKPDPLVDATTDTQIISMMQGVVQRGTGTEVAAVGKPLAGKTGTTSDWFDAWFVGFSPDLVAGVYVGFDDPRTLGDGEVGGHVAAPIFRDFMAAALKDAPAKEFPAPPAAAPTATAAQVAALPNDDGTADSTPDSAAGPYPDPANPDNPYGDPNAVAAAPGGRGAAAGYAPPAGYGMSPSADYAPPPWPDYSATGRGRGYAAAQAASRYDSAAPSWTPSYGGPMPGQYGGGQYAPGQYGAGQYAPPYAGPTVRAVRPAGGTGGLY
ncbi:MAG TPA: PBP1A family penicillin-binding protein [Stellaceae bacterium]|jgi:penicillin-binding protein 1A|nr:PBP1A family penicillin-binding protein [Stellaceae bacterium]